MSRFHREDPCLFVREKLELFLDGELTGSENVAFQAHLKECDDCAAHWADDEIMAAALLVATAPERAPRPRPEAARSAPAPRPGVPERPTRPTGALRAASAALGAAVGALATAIVLLVLDGAFLPPEPAPAMRPEAPNRIVQGVARQRRGAGDDWNDVRAGDALATGDRLWVDDGEVLVGLADGSMAALAAGTMVRLERLPEGRGAPLTVEITHGSVRFDVSAGEVGLRLPRATLAAADATFVASSEHLGESLFVLRGAVEVATELESRVFGAGSGCRLARDGTIAAIPAAASRGEPDAALLVELQAARAEVERLRAENARLVGAVPGPAPVTPEALILAYLDLVEQTAAIDLDAPAPAARTTAAGLRPFGALAIDALVVRLAEERGLRRDAVVALLGLVDLPEAWRVLERRSFDDDESLRHAALRTLANREGEDGVAHFLAVMRSGLDLRSRLIGALQAARRGSGEGVDGAIELHDETDDPFWRMTIVVRLADLERDRAVIDLFLRDLVADPGTMAPVLAAAAKALARRGDRGAVPLLKAAALRPDIGADLARLINEAIFRLESD